MESQPRDHLRFACEQESHCVLRVDTSFKQCTTNNQIDERLSGAGDRTLEKRSLMDFLFILATRHQPTINSERFSRYPIIKEGLHGNATDICVYSVMYKALYNVHLKRGKAYYSSYNFFHFPSLPHPDW